MVHQSDYRREMTNAEAAVVGALLGFGLIALMFYLAVARFHIRKEQLLEFGLYLVVIAARRSRAASNKICDARNPKEAAPCCDLGPEG
jgi:hypothetical protein